MRLLLSFMLLWLAPLSFCLRAEESPAELEAKGVAALKLSQTQPDAVVTAAIYFGNAANGYDNAGDSSKATEMNSFLYWCKKKMTRTQIDTFLKGGDAAAAAVAERMKSLENFAPNRDEAKSYFDRAEAYAQAHPGEHLLIAIRFFEVADRFKGDDTSIQAQDRSLKEMTLAGQSAPEAAPASAEKARPVPEKKVPVPSVAQQKEAEKTIREVFKNEFAKTTSADKLALAQKLFAQADENKDDPASRYEVLVLSGALAAQAADLETLFASCEKLAATFEGNFADLQKLDLGIFIANTKDPSLSKLALAHKTLLDKPNDPAAALLVGKYRFFTKGDTEAGLPLLSTSGHAVLSKLAKDELAKPTQSAAQLALGDEWWDAGEKGDASEKARCRERAVYWYGKVLPTLTGLAKVKIEKRIGTAGAASAGASTPAIDLLKGFQLANNTISGDWSLEQGSLRCVQAGHYSRVKIPCAPGAEYDVRCTFKRTSADGDVGILVIHDGKQGLVFISSHQNRYAGICGYDGKLPIDNETRTDFVLQSNRDYEVSIQVREKFIRTLVGGKELFKANMTGHDLRIDNSWSGVGDAAALGLNCHQSTVVFEKLELIPISASVKHDPATAVAEPPAIPPATPAAPASPAKPPPFNLSLTTEEAHAQAEFVKAYRNPAREGRIAALALLATSYHASSWQMLANAAMNDPEEAVRVAAVETLAREPAHTDKLAHLLAQIYSSLKPTESELKVKFAKAFIPSEFKYEIAAVLADALTRLRFPEMIAYSNGVPQNADYVHNARRVYTGVLQAFTVISNCEIKIPAGDSPAKIKQWWGQAENQRPLIQADRALAEKYKKEDAAAAAKDK